MRNRGGISKEAEGLTSGSQVCRCGLVGCTVQAQRTKSRTLDRNWLGLRRRLLCPFDLTAEPAHGSCWENVLKKLQLINPSILNDFDGIFLI